VLAAARAALAAAGFAPIDYIEHVDALSLVPQPAATEDGRIIAAAWLGHTRLIDNLPVRAKKPDQP
jgi:pantoate--beta-alanine ligase